MKTRDLSYKTAVALTVTVYLALILTIIKPLVSSVSPHELKFLLTSTLFMAVSCLLMTVLAITSRTRANSVVAAVTLIVLLVTKLTLLH